MPGFFSYAHHVFRIVGSHGFFELVVVYLPEKSLTLMVPPTRAIIMCFGSEREIVAIMRVPRIWNSIRIVVLDRPRPSGCYRDFRGFRSIISSPSHPARGGSRASPPLRLHRSRFRLPPKFPIRDRNRGSSTCAAATHARIFRHEYGIPGFTFQNTGSP